MEKSEMSWPKVVENDFGIRPAGKPDECFYCQRKIGEEHGRECVMVVKTVEIAYTFTIPVQVPHFSSSRDIEFLRNESSSCANNILAELQDYATKNGCLCHCQNATYIKDIDNTPRLADK